MPQRLQQLCGRACQSNTRELLEEVLLAKQQPDRQHSNPYKRRQPVVLAARVPDLLYLPGRVPLDEHRDPSEAERRPYSNKLGVLGCLQISDPRLRNEVDVQGEGEVLERGQCLPA